MKMLLKTAFAAAALSVSAMMAEAAAYDLYDHPDRGVPSEYYGLRLDGFGDRFFSFEDASGNSLARMFVDFGTGSGDGTASITGQMRENDGSVWDLSVAMTGVTALDGLGSFGALEYTATLTNVADNTDVLNIDGKGKDVRREGENSGISYEWTLFLQDLGGNTDWRAPNVTAGWVMSVNGQQPTATPNDFLATVVPVPLPAGGLLLLTAIGAIGVARRRKAA